MAITIKKVSTKKELKQFIRFNYKLYKNNPYSVPDLYDDMLNTFNKKKNAAFEFCEADYFLAYKDDKIVGRVAAIINHKANQTWNKKEVRFGWIDFIDDPEVSEALIHTVEEWGKERALYMGHAPFLAPLLHGAYQRFGHFGVVDEVDPAETHLFLVPCLVGLAVDDGGHATHYLVVLVSQEVVRLAELKSGILLLVEGIQHVVIEVGHRVCVVFV